MRKENLDSFYNYSKLIEVAYNLVEYYIIKSHNGVEQPQV